MRGWRRVAILVGLGLLAGVALGLYVGWIALPAEFTDADPLLLTEPYRRDYTVMIADAYSQDGDLTAATTRLVSVGGADAAEWLRTVTVDAILAQRGEAEIRRLVRLAHDLGVYSPAMDPYWPAEAPANGG
jgi:hypothetical protein